MPAVQTPPAAPPLDAAALQRLIRATRACLRSGWGTTGLGLTAGLALAALVAVVAADLVWPLAVPVRVIALLAVVVPAAWVFAVGVARPLLRRLRPVDVARRIEDRIPGMHSRLVSCVDLADGKSSAPVSPAFYRRLVTEAGDRLRGFRPSQIIDWASLKRALAFAGAAAAAFGLLALVFGDRLPTTLARVFLPLADIPPASGVVYAVTAGQNDKGLRGDPLEFVATVGRGEPESLELVLTGDDGRATQRYALARDGEGATWCKTLDTTSLGTGFDAGFTYRVYGGGTWTVKRAVTLLERPAIASLAAVLHYPAYMSLPPRPNGPGVADVTGPGGRADDAENSKVEVVVDAEGSVSEAEVQLMAVRTVRTKVEARPERAWAEAELPAGAQPQGNWQAGKRVEGRPTHTDPPAAGPHMHGFQNAATPFVPKTGESLFAWVYVEPSTRPEGVMLQWQDEAGSWEHSAYWGSNAVHPAGALAPPARGPVPAAGRWVRLEVPAAAAGLEGRSVKGMAFKLHGGQAYWGKVGAVPPEATESRRLDRLLGADGKPVPAFALARAADGSDRWAGSFPLRGDGLYRVELRNELGHANKEMQPAKYAATPDLPPQAAVSKPAADIALSTPAAVPVVVEAFDDYGLKEVRLLVKKPGSAAFEPLTPAAKAYPTPKASDTVVTSLDLPGLGVKVGETVFYLAEVSDRLGQTARTKEFAVRVTADAAAADKALEAFEKNQDPFRDKLVKLIAEQAKVNEKVEKLAAKYGAVQQKIEAARVAEAKAAAKARAADPQAKPDPAAADKLPKLDPQTQKELEEMRAEVGKLIGEEQANVGLAKQMEAELGQLADQAAKNPLLPAEIGGEMKNLQGLFKATALDQLQDLADKMASAARPATPQQKEPDVTGLAKDAGKTQKDLEALAERLKAIADATRAVRNNPDVDAALERFREEMRRQRGDDAGRDLEALKEAIAAMREELERLKGGQGELQEEAKKAADAELPKVEREQMPLDEEIKRALDDARRALANDDAASRRMRRRPDAPDAPYTPEADGEKLPPREQDTDEELPGKKKKDADAKGDPDAKPGEMKEPEDEDEFKPAFGKREKEDERFAAKQRPVEKRPATDAERRRAALEDRQDVNQRDLDRADKGLKADQTALDKMLGQLRAAGSKSKRHAGNNKGGQGDKTSPVEEKAAQELLQQLLGSDQMQQALAMARRMQQGKQGQGQQQGKPGQNQKPSASPVSSNRGNPPPGGQPDAELLKGLDIETRTVLLQMQPKLREELLQGMRDEGPEGYRRHIRTYFKRLTEVQKK